jgi:hypothetical protein
LLPTAHGGSKVHFSRGFPPATFRLQGLVTLLTAYALQSLAGFISHRQRSWDSPFGAFSSRKVSASITGRIDPPTVSPASAPIAEAMSRLGRPRFLGLDPFESPWRSSGGLIRRPLDAPLGLSLPGLAIEGLARTFTRAPLARFADLTITRHTRRRLRVSINLQPASPANDAEAPRPKRRPS